MSDNRERLQWQLELAWDDISELDQIRLSINVEQFLKWLDAWRAVNPNEEWLRVDMLTSKARKGYAKVDTWKPHQSDCGKNTGAN